MDASQPPDRRATSPDAHAHGNPNVTVRDHVVAHLTVAGHADVFLLHLARQTGPDADDRPAGLEGLGLQQLRHQHLNRHGLSW